MQIRYVDTYLNKHDRTLLGFAVEAFARRIAPFATADWPVIGGATLRAAGGRLATQDVVFHAAPLALNFSGTAYTQIMSFLEGRTPSMIPRLVFFSWQGSLYLVDIVYSIDEAHETGVTHCLAVLRQINGGIAPLDAFRMT